MRLNIPTDLSSLLKTGLWRSVGSLGIKVATAGLTYLTYVVLSRSQTPEEYGHLLSGLHWPRSSPSWPVSASPWQ